MLSIVSSKSRALTRPHGAASVPSAEHFSELRRAFLMEHRRPIYYQLLADGQLEAHLKAIGHVAVAELARQTARVRALHPDLDRHTIRASAEGIIMCDGSLLLLPHIPPRCAV